VFHRIDISVLCQSTEDPVKVKEALTFISGSPEGMSEQGFTGTSKNRISLFSCHLTKQREHDAFFKRLNEAGVIRDILADLLDRFDEEMFLNLRFNKQEAYLQRFVLAAKEPKGGVIDVRCRVKAYPAKFDVGLKALNEYLEGLDARS